MFGMLKGAKQLLTAVITAVANVDPSDNGFRHPGVVIYNDDVVAFFFPKRSIDNRYHGRSGVGVALNGSECPTLV